MKKMQALFNSLEISLKNYFFKWFGSDICHNCVSELDISPALTEDGGEKEIEEYSNSYSSVTRWQTV